MDTITKEEKILSILLKEQFETHTATSLAKALGVTRQGVWKSLNKLHADKLISLEQVGNARTSTSMIKLNWETPLTEKVLSLSLTKESLKFQKWRFDFNKLGQKTKFVILFGSIIHSPKEANDIDLLIIANKDKIGEIGKILLNIQQTQLKKVHSTNLTIQELEKELKKPNKILVDAIKRGVILFGQDSFIEFMRGFKK